jgi:hypothetical protein
VKTDGAYSHIKSLSRQRKRLVDWVHERLIGPGDSDEPMRLPDDPVNLFVTAVLFPIITNENGIESGIDPASLSESDDNDLGQNDLESALKSGPPSDKKIRYIPPSAAGFSCYVSENVEIDVFPWAVSYALIKKNPKIWKRITPTGQPDEPTVTLRPPTEDQPNFVSKAIWSDEDHRNHKAEITALWRRHKDGWLLTLSLCNRQRMGESLISEKYNQSLSESTFFEVRFHAEIRAGEIYPYPQKDICRMDEEEQELDLLYRHHLIYAFGHGAAVDWTIHENKVSQLDLSFFPAVEVPLVSPDVPEIEDETLTISFLEGCLEDPAPVFPALDRFVDAYGNWLKDQDETAKCLSDVDRPISCRMLNRVGQAVQRMRQGVQFLRQNPDATKAFGMANSAMLRQMKIGDTLRGRPEKNYRWRPFQLGFFLLSLESVANENSNFRDIVDLIWFPTGGGKTEAYLALIAFLIIWRRLTYKKSGGGTVVILRYTLRLLTQQQFQRSIRLICALELLRRNQPDLLGQEPVTGGLWVGGVTTPNSLEEALVEVKKAKENQRVSSRLLFIECPWCGTSLWHDDSDDDITASGIVSNENRFEFRCPNSKCEFGNTRLPFQVVDEALYQEPPTLLLATVDKFARLAWEERATVFFGKGVVRPPELIVQDELHLITSALGSIAGLYEAALDTVLKLRGVHPKYVASTATIRNASKQVQRLFGRKTAIFPPTGLSIDDSFFARTIPVEVMPGRLYLGYLAPIFPASKSFTPLAAALLLAPIVVFEDRIEEDILDAWWTLVVYHGSLKGVGVSDNLIGHEVNNHVAFLIEKEQKRYNETHDGQKQTDDETEQPKTIQERYDEERHEIVQLTSLVNPEVNSKTLSRMEKPRTDPDHLNVVLTTNMLSVGVDVERLALMVINGQPLTTAEYIQASSRVGRGATPGIVVAHYYRNQARSLSHYENFRPFHESFYRYVEPGSSTPFTAQARERALHAALVIVVRHGVDGFSCNDTAARFDLKDTSIMHALSVLNRRCCLAHPEKESDIQSSLNNLTLEWVNRLNYCRQNRKKLVFSSGNRANASLLTGHDQTKDGLWSTLHSMRNVEENIMMRIAKPYIPTAPEKE